MSVKSGVVTLKGRVPSWRDHDDVGRIAREAGAWRVENDLIVVS